jgi:hypothetical protein
LRFNARKAFLDGPLPAEWSPIATLALGKPRYPGIELTSMVSSAREYSLEQYLLERLMFSGMQQKF